MTESERRELESRGKQGKKVSWRQRRAPGLKGVGMKITGVLGMAAVLGLMLGAIASAQDLQLHVTYVCNGERLFIENCNIRDLSDTANCFVGHPDTILSNGMMKYTNETRGS
jgi:hypothetical protein